VATAVLTLIHFVAQLSRQAEVGQEGISSNGETMLNIPDSTSDTKAGESPSLGLLIDNKIQGLVPVDNLIDDDWQAIREKLLADGHVAVELVNLPAWPQDARWTLFDLANELHCALRVDGQEFRDLFEATLAAMVGLDDLTTHRQGLDCAIQAAALCHPHDPDAAAKKINNRLAQLDAPKKHFRSLTSQIKKAGGQDGDDDAKSTAEPRDMAVAYLEELRGELDVGDDVKVVRFYQGDFYLRDGKRWQRIEDVRFVALVTAFVQRRDIQNLNERYVRDVVCHLRGLTLLNCWHECMPFYVAQEEPLTIERPRLMVFSNGIVDLGKAIEKPKRKPELLDFDVQYFNEIVLPYDFDPKATCPLWLQTIKEILPQKSKTDKRQLVLQEFMGYTLLLECKYQKFVVLIGDGGNGKSTITETWQAVLGEENVSAVGLESLGDEHRQWSLKGKLANFSGELPYLNKVNEGTLKRIVSGEPVDANRKHRDPVKLRLHAKLVNNTNEMPRINDATPATWDRMIVIPFTERFRDTAKDDKDRVEKLRAELPGILMWALKGLVRLQKNGKFTHCELCNSFAQEHRRDSDSVLAFFNECCKPREGHVLFSRRLFDIYRHYCTETGRNKPFGESEFGKRMLRAGCEKIRAKKQSNGKRPPAYRDVDLSEDGIEYWKQIKYRYSSLDEDDDGPAKIGYQEAG
jgi:P4 family phage/plasmid primase-like protien